MDNILLCSNHIPLVTSIHNTFIEKYMLGANGSYVKVYLYLSKCIQAGEEDLSISSLADKMENTEKDIIRALNYWEKKKLLTITRSEDKSVILGIDLLNPDELPEQDTAPAASKGKKQSAEDSITVVADKSSTPTAKETGDFAKAKAATAEAETAEASAAKQHTFQVTPEQMKRLSGEKQFIWICDAVESLLARPIKPKELQLLSYLYDTLHFSCELIVDLYDHCISLGKTSTNYIQSVAIAWDEKGIKTGEEANRISANYNASCIAVSKAFALNRTLAVIEKRYVERWHTEWQMDLSVILEACNRTMLKIQRADFKYTEGILDNWHRAGIHTLMEVQKADEAYAKNKASKKNIQITANNISQREKGHYTSYVQHGLSQDDANALEKRLLSL